MNPRAKGTAFEKEVCEYLQEIGYTVDRARPAMKYAGPGKIFSGPNDFLGVADIIGVHKAMPYTLFVQCTTDHGAAAKKRAKMEEVAWNLVAQRPVVWTKDPSRGVWRAYRLRPNGGPLDTDTQVWDEYIWRKSGPPPTGLL